MRHAFPRPVFLPLYFQPLNQGDLGGKGSDQSCQESWWENYPPRRTSRFFCWQAPPSNPEANVGTRRAKHVCISCAGNTSLIFNSNVISFHDYVFDIFYCEIFYSKHIFYVQNYNRKYSIDVIQHNLYSRCIYFSPNCLSIFIAATKSVTALVWSLLCFPKVGLKCVSK